MNKYFKIGFTTAAGMLTAKALFKALDELADYGSDWCKDKLHQRIRDLAKDDPEAATKLAKRFGVIKGNEKIKPKKKVKVEGFLRD